VSLKAECCGAICVGERDGEPCYGVVSCIGEDEVAPDKWEWIHACQGHREWPAQYVPEVAQ
jgi:hypothetical protein